MDIDELRVYQLAMQLAEKVWEIVLKWDSFAKYSIGKQYTEAADSIGSNMSEGFGRFHFKDSKNFLYYSRGSLYESRTWTIKAHNRKLITDEEYKELTRDIHDLSVKLNNYINTIGKSSNNHE
ncbi:MAG: four helix bundle protein [Lentimicrobiaceae bacterium]